MIFSFLLYSLDVKKLQKIRVDKKSSFVISYFPSIISCSFVRKLTLSNIVSDTEVPFLLMLLSPY